MRAAMPHLRAAPTVRAALAVAAAHTVGRAATRRLTSMLRVRAALPLTATRRRRHLLGQVVVYPLAVDAYLVGGASSLCAPKVRYRCLTAVECQQMGRWCARVTYVVTSLLWRLAVALVAVWLWLPARYFWDPLQPSWRTVVGWQRACRRAQAAVDA